MTDPRTDNRYHWRPTLDITVFELAIATGAAVTGLVKISPDGFYLFDEQPRDFYRKNFNEPEIGRHYQRTMPWPYSD